MSDDLRLISIDEAGKMMGLSRSTILQLLNTFQLAQVRIGSRRMVVRSSIVDFIARGGDR